MDVGQGDMIYTLFFSRLRKLGPAEQLDYAERSEALRSLASDGHPGFVDLKTYAAEDGERLTVARFRDLESQDAWRMEPLHREAQRLGREAYYEEYHITSCQPVKEHGWRRSAGEVAGGGGGT